MPAGVSPLSPVLKSLLADNEPAAVLHRGRESLMRRIESRFRFLAVRLLSCSLPLPSERTALLCNGARGMER